jgi:hypothetical protein
MRKHLLIALPLICCVSRSSAQPARVLKEEGLQKLSVFVGTWKAEATDAANKGKISAVNSCQWSVNGGFLIADQAVTINGTKVDNLSIYHYNAATDDYTLTIVGIPGREPFTVPIAYRGDTLIYHSVYTDNGKRYFNRTLNIFDSRDSYVYLIQASEDSVHWQTNGEGRSVRSKP